MFCPNCGKSLSDTDKFCTDCGAPVERNASSSQTSQTGYTAQQSTYADPQPTPPPANPAGMSAGKVSFPQAIKLFFKNYASFTGRSSRSEYWWAFLFLCLVNAVCGIIDNDIVTSLWNLAVLVPDLALLIRREHDIGRRWTRILLLLIPLVGVILIIVDAAKESAGDNQWGPANPN